MGLPLSLSNILVIWMWPPGSTNMELVYLILQEILVFLRQYWFVKLLTELSRQNF